MENSNNIPNIPKMRKEEDDKESLFSDSSSNRYRSKSRSRSKENSQVKYNNTRDHRDESEDKKFIMKNGCCRECMRAFSKSGKSCLCQVPKFERKYTLSDKGCNFCGCHGKSLYFILGCNPVDVRKEKRKDTKRQLREDNNILYKKQRLLDSDDEELKVYQNDADEWNKKRRDLISLLANNFRANIYSMGFGTPLRTPSYILGYHPSKHEPEPKRRPSNPDYKRRGDRKRSEDSYAYEK